MVAATYAEILFTRLRRIWDGLNAVPWGLRPCARLRGRGGRAIIDLLCDRACFRFEGRGARRGTHGGSRRGRAYRRSLGRRRDRNESHGTIRVDLTVRLDVMAKIRARNIRSGLLWIMIIAFIAMTTPVRATWQCLDGTPCPSAHMARLSAPPVAATTDRARRHSCCDLVAHQAANSPAVRPNPCVQRADSSPDSRIVSLDLAASDLTPASLPSQAQIVIADSSSRVITADLLPPRPPECCTGSSRAPPVHA